ncbi:MAG: NAD(P)H-dependent oxidoreductase [Candidatus Methanomethylophilus sp.]|nr:NAD(P)H-dependent oxidoreductase [Methanomethylophilus sp.]MBQ5482771.1 NAD(P)H-dependent oxidoreductase [Methanomethylophilus sp.]
MSKIVAVMGSANNNGNTAAAVDAILDGAMGLSTNVIRYHNLGKLNSVNACDFGELSGKGLGAVQDSDLRAILEDIASADAVLFATPLYFNFPTPQFTMILDSMACLGKSPLSGKKAVVLVTCEKVDTYSNGALDCLVNAIESLGMCVVSKMIFSTHCGQQQFRENSVAMDKAVKVGAKFSKTFDVEPDSEVIVLG